jgi:hypothetical protein
MRAENGRKYLTAARLIELLATLPPDSRVAPNTVGNLLVRTPDNKTNLAYVDFISGKVESMQWDGGSESNNA